MENPMTSFLTPDQIIKQFEARIEVLAAEMRNSPNELIRGQFNECEHWLNLFKEVHGGKFDPPKGFTVKSVD